MVIIKPREKRITLTMEELKPFVNYLNRCRQQAFVGINYYERQQVREDLLKFSLSTIFNKAAGTLLRNQHQLANKKLKIPVNKAEEITLSNVFKRVDCGPYLLAVEHKILMILRPLKSYTEI